MTFNQLFELLHPVPLEMASEVHSLFLQTWWAGDRDLTFTKALLSGSTYSWGMIGRSDQQLRGFTRVVSDGIAKATIYDVIIDDTLRGQGLGIHFLNRVISSPILQKVEHVELYCKPEMMGFYGKLNICEIKPEVRLLRLRRS